MGPRAPTARHVFEPARCLQYIRAHTRDVRTCVCVYVCVLSTCVFVCAHARSRSRPARAGGAAHLISVRIYTKTPTISSAWIDTNARARRFFAHTRTRALVAWHACQHDSATTESVWVVYCSTSHRMLIPRHRYKSFAGAAVTRRQ